MNGSLWLILVYGIPSAIGALLCLALLFALIRKPSWLLFSFFCFYLIGVSHLAGALVARSLASRPGALGLRQFWDISLAIGRSRYIFLILFAHSAYRFRATPALTLIVSLIIALAIASPFFVYSIIPNLAEIAAVVYAFLYWLYVYLKRAALAIPPARLRLLRSVLACSGFFLTGLVIDLLEGIPQASVYVSILLFDFHPFFMVGIGVVMAAWALGDVRRAAAPEAPSLPAGAVFAGPPVTRREREIIDLILRGETNASIARRLFISESTVKKHVNNIFRKLKIASRWELLKMTASLHPKE